MTFECNLQRYTVGYGDYSPVTVLGRLFIIIFIVAGVAFFSIETGNLMTILALTNSGKGKYHPKKKNGKHVVGLCRLNQVDP